MKRKLPLALAACATLPALAAILPFTENFNSGMGEFTVEDTNQDNKTIKTLSSYGYDYTNAVYYSPSDANMADDWLFTPAFNLKKGYVYKLTYRWKGLTAGSVNRVEWKAGTEASSEAMTVKLADPVELAGDKEWYQETVNITVPANGEYHIGLHVISQPSQGQLYFDDIEISEGANPSAPCAVTVEDPKFSVINDKLAATFEVTLPTLNGAGTSLDADEEISVRVGREDNASYASIKGKPGETVDYTDADALAVNADYTFTCLIGDAESESVTVTAFPRLGTPKGVENFKVVQNGNEFTLSWDAVKEGINSSYVFVPSLVTYTVKCGAATVVENTSDLSATYTCPLPEEGQEAVSFSIIAYEGANSSNIVKSDSYLIGNPYEGEFRESFANYKFTKQVWTVENDKNNAWRASVGSSYPVTIDPQDDDNGCLQFSYDAGGSLRIWSPALDLSSLTAPKLSFYAFLDPSSYYDTSIQPGFKVGDNETLLGSPIALNSGEARGWTEFIFDVPAEPLTSTCQLMFVGVGAGSSANFFIDNISITSMHADNIAVSVAAPGRSIEIGDEAEFTVTVLNKGTKTASGYTLSLLADGEKVDETDGPSVAAKAEATATLKYKALPKSAGEDILFTVVADFENDGDLSDNEAEVTLGVRENSLERPQTLSHNLSQDLKKVALAWEAPAYATEPTEITVVEGFEHYNNGATEGAEGWIFRDLSENERKGINNLNNGQAFPAMVIENFVPANSWELSLTSYEGEKCLAICQGNSYGEPVKSLIISPEVKGGTEVSFQTTMFSDFGSNAELTIYWSMGETDEASFSELTTIYAKDGEWVEKSFELPARAKRFAIGVDGKLYYPVLIDAITYTTVEQPVEFKGYNVYRDHSLMTTLPADATSFVDESPVQKATHTYHVTALYDKGESAYSNPATVLIDLPSGIEEIIDDATSDIQFFNLQGLPIERGEGVEKGEIVIVRQGNKTYKAILK